MSRTQITLETQIMTVLLGDRTEEWELDVDVHFVGPRPVARLTLREPDGTETVAEDWNLFDSLFKLREQVEPNGVLLCCNGSRRDAWASGMCRDMGNGATLYLLGGTSPGQSEPFPDAMTLDPALPNEVVPLAEQIAWYEAWLSTAT